MGHGFVRRGTALLPSGAADGPTVSATQSLSIEQERQPATLRRQFSAFGLRVAGKGKRSGGAAKARPGRRQRFIEAVSAALRLHCGARARVPSRNSLCSLRSLRSNKRGGSDDEALRAATSPVLLSASKARCRLPGRVFANTAGLCVAKTDAVGSRCAVLCNGVCQGAPVRHGGALRCAHPRRWLAADGVPRTFQTTGRTRRQPRSGTGHLRTAGLIRLQANPSQCPQGRPGALPPLSGGSERSKRGGSTQPQAPCASAQPITAIGAPSGLMKVSGPRKVM